ncbi:hypothetical protein D3C84_01930 [compost metagenome]
MKMNNEVNGPQGPFLMQFDSCGHNELLSAAGALTGLDIGTFCYPGSLINLDQLNLTMGAPFSE